MRFCPYQHLEKRPNGRWARGENWTLGRVETANGVTQIKARCNNCGERSGALPRFVLDQLRVDYLTVLPLFSDHQGGAHCVVRGCQSSDYEYHHFAPRNTFGDQADDWPCLPLCRAHHREWHDRMDGYRWARAAGA